MRVRQVSMLVVKFEATASSIRLNANKTDVFTSKSFLLLKINDDVDLSYSA